MYSKELSDLALYLQLGAGYFDHFVLLKISVLWLLLTDLQLLLQGGIHLIYLVNLL